ncbi:hypothetical protein [Kosakonia radicincitans]|uniref:hypothetical protein n=1 Tax=Kosakonia radicincitans TaxID=283686 RepID=UPI001D05D65E|nr:hypothetical protein [Kosakonia radicincitans]
MKFGIDRIDIWSRSGKLKSLKFERNKVNVITGGSQTGKSTILKIFDYCFLASEHNIPHDVINDNVGWYGISFYINNSDMFIARKSPEGNEVSSVYYFSSIGECPHEPYANIKEDDLRKIIETQFSIDDTVKIVNGGRGIKSGSKVSFRYFFLFNTMSDDVIINSKNFFEKQEIERYRNALPRVFDLALGIDDLDNILSKEKKESLLYKINKIQRDNSRIDSNYSYFDNEIKSLAARSAEFGLISDLKEDNTNPQVLLNHLKQYSYTGTYSSLSSKRHSELAGKIFLLDKK